MNRLLLFIAQCVLLKESFGMPTANYLPTLPYGMDGAQYPQSFSTNEAMKDMYSNDFGNLASLVPNPAINNIQVSPVISEVVPSLQYGDVNMAGELPIGGTIKVSGCFPVYGMVAVDGSVPSSGTAVVSESFGNQVMDVVSKCASQYFSN